MEPIREQQELYQYLRQLVDPDRLAANRHPEFARVEAYWHIGRIIVETEQQGEERAEYGIQLIESLSVFLTGEFGKGYGHANLWWFRQFYIHFPILHAVRGEFTDLRQILRTELTWTHYRILLTIDNPQKRHFYLHTTADEGWSTRTLARLIKSRYYEQVALGEEQLTAQPERMLGTAAPKSSRSQVAHIRQQILSQPGWAMLDLRGSGISVGISKPSLLFYRIDQQRYVGVWIGKPSAGLQEKIRQQLDEWQRLPAVQVGNPAVGLLVDDKMSYKLVTSLGSPLPNASQINVLTMKT
ncbi:hypothetical protein GCM10027347_50930 [Larkinella harenae]